MSLREATSYPHTNIHLSPMPRGSASFALRAKASLGDSTLPRQRNYERNSRNINRWPNEALQRHTVAGLTLGAVKG